MDKVEKGAKAAPGPHAGRLTEGSEVGLFYGWRCDAITVESEMQSTQVAEKVKPRLCGCRRRSAGRTCPGRLPAVR